MVLFFRMYCVYESAMVCRSAVSLVQVAWSTLRTTDGAITAVRTAITAKAPMVLTRVNALVPAERAGTETGESARGLAHSKTLRVVLIMRKSEGLGVRQSSGAFPRGSNSKLVAPGSCVNFMRFRFIGKEPQLG